MAKITVWPYVMISCEGKLQGYHLAAYSPWGDKEKNGGTVDTDGEITICLSPIEIEVPEVPLPTLEERAIALIRLHKDKIRAEHHVLMTRLQMTENALLRLESPEILDLVGKRHSRPDDAEDVEGRIPF